MQTIALHVKHLVVRLSLHIEASGKCFLSLEFRVIACSPCFKDLLEQSAQAQKMEEEAAKLTEHVEKQQQKVQVLQVQVEAEAAGACWGSYSRG